MCYEKNSYCYLCPTIQVDKQDNTFIIYHSPNASTYLSGSYVIDNNFLIAKGVINNTRCVCYFEIIDRDTLEFEQKQSSSLDVLNRLTINKIENGSTFKVQR